MNVVDIPIAFHLSTAQIHPTATDTTVSNTIGGWDNARQTYYFLVKLRNILGHNYDKYNKFVISVVQIFAINSTALATNYPLQLQMGGLGWENSSYDAVSKANGYWVPIMNAIHTSGALASTSLSYDILSNSFVFRKGDPEVRLDFRFIDITTNQLASITAQAGGAGVFPTMSVFFKINPLQE